MNKIDYDWSKLRAIVAEERGSHSDGLFRRFVQESNRIEGIVGAPRVSELVAFKRFMALKAVTVADLEHLVSVCQPGAVLRDKPGMDVRIGKHQPLPGGPEVRAQLTGLLGELGAYSPYENHLVYETLHPFMDGNGRSGRALWAWQVRDLSLGFLHAFYYQALSAHRPAHAH